MNDKKITCRECHEALNKRELITNEISGIALCDICMAKQRRLEVAQRNNEEKLRTVPQVYADTHYGPTVMSAYETISLALGADMAPVGGTQFIWDLIKYLWGAGKEARYLAIKDYELEYQSMPWQSRRESVGQYAMMPGMLAIDGIDHNTNKELLARILEYRAEHGLHTVIVLHVPYKALADVAGEKAAAIISSRWKYICLESG